MFLFLDITDCDVQDAWTSGLSDSMSDFVIHALAISNKNSHAGRWQTPSEENILLVRVCVSFLCVWVCQVNRILPAVVSAAESSQQKRGGRDMTSQGGRTEEIVLMLRIDSCLMWWLCHSHLKIQTNPQEFPCDQSARQFISFTFISSHLRCVCFRFHCLVW